MRSEVRSFDATKTSTDAAAELSEERQVFVISHGSLRSIDWPALNVKNLIHANNLLPVAKKCQCLLASLFESAYHQSHAEEKATEGQPRHARGVPITGRVRTGESVDEG